MDFGIINDIDNVIIGKKQTKRLILKNQIKTVYIAKDAENNVIEEIVQLCIEKKIELIYVDKMEELGKTCNIDVNAAVAAVLK